MATNSSQDEYGSAQGSRACATRGRSRSLCSARRGSGQAIRGTTTRAARRAARRTGLDRRDRRIRRADGGRSRGASAAGGRTVGLPMRAWQHLTPDASSAELRWSTSYAERIGHLLATRVAIALPGGIGTLAEASAVWAAAQTEPGAAQLVLVGPAWRALIDVFAERTCDRREGPCPARGGRGDRRGRPRRPAPARRSRRRARRPRLTGARAAAAVAPRGRRWLPPHGMTSALDAGMTLPEVSSTRRGATVRAESMRKTQHSGRSQNTNQRNQATRDTVTRVLRRAGRGRSRPDVRAELGDAALRRPRRRQERRRRRASAGT